MSRQYRRPKYVLTKPHYLVEIPFVQTSGRPGSRYEWNNAAHAAIHSILAGLIHGRSKHCLTDWLLMAKRQLDAAVKEIQKPHAQPLPARPAKPGVTQ